VWAALLASVLGALGAGIQLVNVVLQQVFSAKPALNSPANLEFGHYLAVLVVAVVVGVYHWRVLRADAASRPHKHEAAAVVLAPATTATFSTSTSIPTAQPVAEPEGKRFILSVVDATEDDVHQVLAGLPPAASYLLTPLDPEK
jgi:hypothetical protein